MATQTSASTVAIIRPEFQLCQVTNPQGFLNKQTGIFLPAGTIYARLYFPKGCTPIGNTVKGKVVYDSRKQQRARGNEQFELLIVCNNVAEYRKLYITCGKSNMLGNRKRTDLLMRDLNNNGIGTRGAIVYTFPKVETVTETQPEPQPEPEPQLVVETELVASPDHIKPTPEAAVIPTLSTDLEFVKKYAPRTLRRICKNFGILTPVSSGESLKQYTHDQLVARGITAIAIKQMFNPKF